MSSYKQDHLLAKLIVALLVVILLYLDGTFTLLQGTAVFVWFFGINFFGRIIECVRKHAKHHDWI